MRKVVGPDVPVGVELDLHCNIGEGTMRDATALVLFKEYPHVDVSDRADDLFNVMEGAIEGRTKPVMATWDCRMIGVFHTTRQPMRGFVDKLQAMEGKEGVLSLSIAHGFPWSDIKEMGSKLIAITDGDRPKAERLARELGKEFYAMRAATQPPYVTLDAAMARVSSHNLPKPMVLADVSDNAGGGAATLICRRRRTFSLPNGPQTAKVTPGTWTLKNRVWPSGEKVAPPPRSGSSPAVLLPRGRGRG